MTSAADRAYLRELKQAEPFTGLRVDNRDGVPCKFQILGRGEMAFFQLGERALLFELLAGPAVIFAKSIRRWDDRSRVTDEEREDIIAIASEFLTSKGAPHVEVVR
jgi:hypothetical protein